MSLNSLKHVSRMLANMRVPLGFYTFHMMQRKVYKETKVVEVGSRMRLDSLKHVSLVLASTCVPLGFYTFDMMQHKVYKKAKVVEACNRMRLDSLKHVFLGAYAGTSRLLTFSHDATQSVHKSRSCRSV